MDATEHLELLAQGRLQAVALQLRGTQAEDQRPELVERLPRQVAQTLDLPTSRRWVAVELCSRGFGRQHQAEQLLADDIMQLVGEPVALRQD